jgi:hypothetical protein
MAVRIDKLESCFMVVIDGRDERQFDFTKSSRSVRKAKAEAEAFALETERARKLRWIVDPYDGNLRLATYDPQA